MDSVSSSSGSGPCAKCASCIMFHECRNPGMPYTSTCLIRSTPTSVACYYLLVAGGGVSECRRLVASCKCVVLRTALGLQAIIPQGPYSTPPPVRWGLGCGINLPASTGGDPALD